MAASLEVASLPLMAAWPSPDLSPSGSLYRLWVLLEPEWRGQHSDTEPVLSVVLSSGESRFWVLAIGPREGGGQLWVLQYLPSSLQWHGEPLRPSPTGVHQPPPSLRPSLSQDSPQQRVLNPEPQLCCGLGANHLMFPGFALFIGAVGLSGPSPVLSS